MTYYLSYGSNLQVKGMKTRCPDAKPIGPVYLNNARLVFRGVADFEIEHGSIMPAGLWEVSDADQEKLDTYEGVRSGLYDRCWVPLPDRGGVKALIYKMRDDGIYRPSAWYVSVIRDGYRNFKLDESFLNAAIRHSFEQERPSDQTRARRKRQQLSGYQHSLVNLKRLEKEA